MSKKLQKKNLLVELDKPFIVRHEANEKHNEVTVAIIKYAMPLQCITRIMTQQILKEVRKIAVIYPSANIQFNFNQENPAFLFTCKGKTERRGDDTPDQELADKIAITKCRAKASAISERITVTIAEALIGEVKHIREVAGYFLMNKERELNYIKKM